MTDVAPKKLQAIELLALGIRPGEVARRIGISRPQLWRWRTQDPVFASAYRDLLREAQTDRQERMSALVDGAMAVAEELLEEGDPGMAMTILRLAGPALLSGDAEGVRDPRIIDVKGRAVREAANGKELPEASGPERHEELPG